MRIGELRKRVIVQAESKTPDAAGGYTLGWTNFASMWAEIEPASGQEHNVAAHLEGHVTHRITMRYLSGVTTDMRIFYNSRVFNIRAVLNTDERNQWMELLAEEGTAV